MKVIVDLAIDATDDEFDDVLQRATYERALTFDVISKRGPSGWPIVGVEGERAAVERWLTECGFDDGEFVLVAR